VPTSIAASTGACCVFFTSASAADPCPRARSRGPVGRPQHTLPLAHVTILASDIGMLGATSARIASRPGL
jgi:hypothetical protein